MALRSGWPFHLVGEVVDEEVHAGVDGEHKVGKQLENVHPNWLVIWTIVAETETQQLWLLSHSLLKIL